ncbi:hypothetical protein [Tuwongella immobilis]|uniref:Uncharacterized protein n=1 Tax=Tuwongella immobilis TaxID=692036 RepID=A0A6C2YJE8_9BACT|nr:hypothetical protein [Tuwongella immobilis]VIP01092.1 unnamed protein product [Tuwongella immobilis]VTR97609.1 unnamed protein product [Tuwongella immobilis]
MIPRLIILAIAFMPIHSIQGADTPIVTEDRLPIGQWHGKPVRLPAAPPRPHEVLDAVTWQAGAQPQVQSIELDAHRVHPERFFPLVGLARLHAATYRCVVQTTTGAKTIYLDQHALVLPQ